LILKKREGEMCRTGKEGAGKGRPRRVINAYSVRRQDIRDISLKENLRERRVLRRRKGK